MDKNEKDFEIDIKGEVSKGRNLNPKREPPKENSVDKGLPELEDSESNENEKNSESDKENANQDENLESDEEKTEEDAEENSDEEKPEDEDSEEEDSEDESDEDSEDDEEKAEEDKPEDDKPSDNDSSNDNSNRYNNNRKNINPNRAEAAKNVSAPKPQEKGGSKIADAAKDAIKNKVPGGETVDKAKKVADNAVKLSEFVANSTNTLIQVLINPITWVVLLVFVILIYAVSFNSTVGQNDYNIMCDSSGVGSITIDPSADDFTRQSAIASWMTSTPFELNGGQPLTKEQAAASIGNMAAESYGANPKAIQGDPGTTKWETTDNDAVLGWGNVGGKAIGIVQWDTGRRISMVNFAKSEGTQWHDLTTQLKFLKQEMESGYEHQQLVRGGFNTPGKTVAEYTKIWNIYFERSGASGTPAGDNPRIALAEAFAGAYTGGGSSSLGSLSNNCVGGSSSGEGIDTSSLIQLAISAVHPRRAQAMENCGNALVNCGMNTATDIYKKAKLAAEASTGKDPISGLLASCDRFVATIYRATGKDVNYPWGSAETQANYMKSSPAWEQVSCQDKVPGDVIWRNGHIMLYVGLVNGTDSIASASLGERSGNLSGITCQGANYIADGGSNIGFRKVK